MEITVEDAPDASMAPDLEEEALDRHRQMVNEGYSSPVSVTATAVGSRLCKT